MRDCRKVSDEISQRNFAPSDYTPVEEVLYGALSELLTEPSQAVLVREEICSFIEGFIDGYLEEEALHIER